MGVIVKDLQTGEIVFYLKGGKIRDDLKNKIVKGDSHEC